MLDSGLVRWTADADADAADAADADADAVQQNILEGKIVYPSLWYWVLYTWSLTSILHFF